MTTLLFRPQNQVCQMGHFVAKLATFGNFCFPFATNLFNWPFLENLAIFGNFFIDPCHLAIFWQFLFVFDPKAQILGQFWLNFQFLNFKFFLASKRGNIPLNLQLCYYIQFSP